MDNGFITYDQATGAAPFSPPPPAAPPAASADDDGSGDLVVHPKGPTPAPTVMPPVAAQTSDAAAPASKIPSDWISYEQATTPPTPNKGGMLSNTADDGYGSGALKGAGTAAIKAIGNAAGFVGGLGGFADYLVARGEHAVTGKPVETILADMAKAKKDQEEHAASTLGIPSWTDPRNVLPAPSDVSGPILAKTGEYVPTTEPGKMAQAATEAVLSSVGPGAGAKAGTMGEVLRGAATMAPGNAAAGAAAQGVTDATGDPLLGAGIGMAAPAAAHLGAAGVGKVVGPAVAAFPASTPLVGPAINNAVENAAAKRLIGSASDPEAAKAAILAHDPASVDIPGTTPTTAAVANDLRLLEAEKTARGVGGANPEFNARDAVQNSARLSALNAVQPTGDVFRPGQFIQQNLEAVDAAAQRAQDQLESAHAQAVAARAQGTQDATDRLTQSFQSAHDQLLQKAQDAAAPLGTPVDADAIGATLRTAQQEATTAAKAARDALYRAVDPDGTLATVVTPLKESKTAIAAGIDPHTGVQPSGAEAKIWSDIDRLPDVIPFRSLQKLDSRVTAAMVDARRNPDPNDPEAISRLTQLKSAVMAAIHDGVEHQAAHEARLVKDGVLPEEQALQARLQREWVDRFYADRTARAAGDPEFGAGSSRGRSSAAPRIYGAEGEAGRRVGSAPSDPAGQEGNLQPNFDQAAADRLTAAKAAHADYAQTFKNPTVKPILDTNGFAGQYKLPNGAVPSKAIVPGDKGFDTATVFLRASNNDPRAIAAMQDAILNPLRRGALTNGTIHPNGLARWKEQYGSALRAIDAASPGFSSRFDTAANTTQAVLDAGIAHQEQLRAFQQQAAAEALTANASSKLSRDESIARVKAQLSAAKGSPAGKFAAVASNAIAPTEVENAVGAMLKTGTGGAARMRSLVQSVSADPDALDGLRKAGVDWIVRNHQNADGTLSSGKFISFIRDNRDVLKELYPTGQISMFGAVARSLETDARWVTSTAAKNGPGTAKDLAPHVSESTKAAAKHTSMAVVAMEGLDKGMEIGGWKGVTVAAAAPAAYLLNTLRSAGIRRVDQLYTSMLIDPEIAKVMLSKMPALTDTSRWHALSRAVRRGLILGPHEIGMRSNENGSS